MSCLVTKKTKSCLFSVILKDKIEYEMGSNHTDVNTRLEMLLEHVLDILGSLSPKNSLSCLVTFVVNIVKNSFICQDCRFKF